MTVRRIGHANLRAPAGMIERLRRFYTDVVGLREGPRPAFRSGSRGFWLYAGDRDVLHLTISAEGDAAPQDTGIFNHLAFTCEDLASARIRLDKAGVSYQSDIVDELGQVQLFLTDPAGIVIELTFTDREAGTLDSGEKTLPCADPGHPG